MADGAHMGVSASRAVATIIGGEPAPTADEGRNPVQMREWLESCPDYTEADYATLEDGYGECARWFAKRMLAAVLADPSLMQSERLFTAVVERDPEVSALAHGQYGPTGFQVGWAQNAVRYCVELEPAVNPAIITVGPTDGGPADDE